jgi:nucleoside-diphosphate-sugar epimerase
MSGFAAVTGANGFVGSNLCDTLLSRGWKVRGVVRPSSNLKWLDSSEATNWIKPSAMWTLFSTAPLKHPRHPFWN